MKKLIGRIVKRLTVGPKGGQGKEITSTRGNPLSPSQKPGTNYRLVDPTKNKSNK